MFENKVIELLPADVIVNSRANLESSTQGFRVLGFRVEGAGGF